MTRTFRSSLLGGLIGAALLAAPVVMAQPQSGGAASPPAAHGMPDLQNVPADALEAARGMIQEINGADMAERTMAQVAQQISAVLAQSSGKPVAEVSRIIDEVLMPEFRARTPELMEFTTRLWASQMSAAELRELTAFYRTPLGKKLNEVAPTVATQSALFGMRWGQEVGLSALTKHRDELRARGLKI